MKKIYVLAFALIGGLNLNAQMMQGNVSIDPYIGVPNWANSILWNQYVGSNPTVQNYGVLGSMLSYGGRIEYMLSENVGMGADVNFEVSGFQYDFTDYVYGYLGDTLYDANNNPIYTTYNYKYTAKKFRAMLRLNYHFVQSEKVDFYAAFAGGYKNTNRTVVTNPINPNFNDANANRSLIPISFRVAVGAKMYFTNNIGAHVELGAFGGGLLQAGISVDVGGLLQDGIILTKKFFN